MGLALVRADPTDPGSRAYLRALVRQAVALAQDQHVLVADREFRVAVFQEEKRAAWVVRLVKNFPARRATPPAYGGRGRPATEGVLVLPLARSYRGKVIPATPPDRYVHEPETCQRLPELALLAGAVLSLVFRCLDMGTHGTASEWCIATS